MRLRPPRLLRRSGRRTRRYRLCSFTLEWLEKQGLVKALPCILGSRARCVRIVVAEPAEGDAPERCTCYGTGAPFPGSVCPHRWMRIDGKEVHVYELS